MIHIDLPYQPSRTTKEGGPVTQVTQATYPVLQNVQKLRPIQGVAIRLHAILEESEVSCRHGDTRPGKRLQFATWKNGPFIVSFPIQNGDFPWIDGYIYNNKYIIQYIYNYTYVYT